MVVKASIWPPTESIARAMSSADAGLGALEDQMLDEVGDPAAVGRLVTGPGLHPDAHGDRADMGHPLRDEPDPVGQDVFRYSPSRLAGPITRPRDAAVIPVPVPTAPPIASAIPVAAPIPAAIASTATHGFRAFGSG